MDFYVFFSVLNFISIIILYATILYVYDLQVKTQYDFELVKDYQRTNEAQLKNLIKDINKNDRGITELVMNQH